MHRIIISHCNNNIVRALVCDEFIIKYDIKQGPKYDESATFIIICVRYDYRVCVQVHEFIRNLRFGSETRIYHDENHYGKT